MSIQISKAVWALRGVPHTYKLAILRFAEHASDTGICWPSVPKVAADCELTDRTVQKAITWGIKHGLMRREERRGKVAHYFLTPEQYSPPNDIHLECDDVPPVREATTPVNGCTVYREPSEEPSTEPPIPIKVITSTVTAVPVSASRASTVPVASRATKKVPLSDEWRPNDAHRKRCAELGFDADELAFGDNGFRNYHHARATLFADWNRAFFVWIGNAKRFGAKPGGASRRTYNQQPTASIIEAGLRVAARYTG